MKQNTVVKSITRTLTLTAALLAISTASVVAENKSPADLNDMEIAHVAYTAGSIDIRYAHLALATTDNPDVRAFAETMIRDHSAINDQALKLVNELGITPQDNFLSQSLIEGSRDILAELRDLTGDAFDHRYAENELKYHQTVNSVVGDVFIHNAKTPELIALLKSALDTFKIHEQHAKNMVAKTGS